MLKPDQALERLLSLIKNSNSKSGIDMNSTINWVFHCHLSLVRGPSTAALIDRALVSYQKKTLKDITLPPSALRDDDHHHVSLINVKTFVLEGGFKAYSKLNDA